MQRQIPTIWGVLIILLVAAAAGTIIVFFSKETEKINIVEHQALESEVMPQEERLDIFNEEEKAIKICENWTVGDLIEEQEKFISREDKAIGGKLTETECSLNLFSNEENLNTSYYIAGVFLEGELKGHFRVIVSYHEVMYSGSYVLATKNFEEYILDSHRELADIGSTLLDFDKITHTDSFKETHPRKVELDENLVLYGKKLVNLGFDRYKPEKMEEECEELQPSVDNLAICWRKYEGFSFEESDVIAKLRNKYLLGDSSVYIKDSTGLYAQYSLTTPEKVELSGVKEVGFDLGFLRKEIESEMDTEYYSEYQTAIPGECAIDMTQVIADVSSEELEKVGYVHGLPLYRLKDKNHDLYRLAYKNKTDYWINNPEFFERMNPGKRIPSLEDYVAKNPLLFIEDYWGRFAMSGEWDIQLPGGCGKPVIYLYPEEDTKVSIEFGAEVELTTQVPKYKEGWEVLASPSGYLLDLQKEEEDCKEIDSTKRGLEYAKEACRENNYPYIYWAGNIFSGEYPRINEGWIVEKDNIEIFLEERLKEMGFNKREMSDFLEYWVPELKEKDSPYYRISFLQTEIVNNIFPMNVNPLPDSVLRIFMDYSLLEEVPQEIPEPQKLNSFKREGFTLVEWGGLKLRK